MKHDFLQFDSSVKAVLGSETFKRASKIRKLLEFLADRTAALGSENVTAQLVATAFFQLTAQQAEKSSIHRVQISRLKTLLTDFYRQEGRNQSWQLSILAGCYGLDLVPSADDQSNFSPRLAITRDEAAYNNGSLLVNLRVEGWTQPAKWMAGVLRSTATRRPVGQQGAAPAKHVLVVVEHEDPERTTRAYRVECVRKVLH